MPKFNPKITTLLLLTFLITLGLAISLQEVFGINIGSDLNFALTGKKITGLPVPVASSDAATRGYVDSVASSGVPAGAVMYFNLAACPSGWTVLAAAQGRYLVGLPAAGTLAGTDGTALTNLEDRPTGVHSHTITDPGHFHNQTFTPFWIWGFPPHPAATQDISGQWHGTIPTASALTGVTVNNSAGTAGTNAPYLQLLVCQKN